METLIAKVSFFDSHGIVEDWRQYDYLTLEDDLKEGDLVVVETRNGYKVASFVRYAEVSDKATSFIITSVDVDSVEKYKKRKQEKEDILKAIEKREKELLEEKRLRELANDDEVIKDLVEQYYGEDK